MFKSFRLLIVTAALCASAVIVSAQTLTEGNLLKAVQTDPQGEKLIPLLQKVEKISLDLSLEGQVALATKGVPQNVIDALVSRQDQLGGKSEVKKTSVLAESSDTSTAIPATKMVPKTSAAGYPLEEGVYYRPVSKGNWVSIEAANRDMNMSGIGKTVILGSIVPFVSSGISEHYDFPGREAEVKTGPHPEFLVKANGLSKNEIGVVRLKVEKDKRTFKAGGINRFGIPKLSPDKKSFVQEAKVERVDTDAFIVTFRESLEPGEYAFRLGMDAPRFDFSVQTNSQLAQQ